MGVVYAAHDDELDRTVAIKVIRSGQDGARGRTRLLREARALAQLSDPHVVSIYEVGVHGDQVWIAMEHVVGETLTKWLARGPSPGEHRPWR
ncbi:MAG: protein kinase, partial [Myxococcales bacterium]|nr:protein kinase [Myxococcales bacterium]